MRLFEILHTVKFVDDGGLNHAEQTKVRAIYRIARATSAKIDAVLSAAPGGSRKHNGDFAMADPLLDEALAAVTASSSRTDSLIAFVGTLKQQLDDALSGVTLPPAVRDKITQILTIEQSDAAKIDLALNTGVPAPPTA